MNSFILHSSRKFIVPILIVVFAISFITVSAQTQHADEPVTVESYYKVKWGFASEFINLWMANHYPLNKKAMEKGDILSITAEKPMMHSGEDNRWDFKVTIVYRNADLALDHSIIDAYKKQLYPDLAKLAKEEQYRFTLLLAHWDILTEKIELK